MKKGIKKCVWCSEYKKCKFKKGAKRFCSLGHKNEYYANDIPTLKREIQLEFNKLITQNQSCAMCGKRFEKMDCSHIISRGSHDSLRFDILNVLPMCSRDHQWNWHDSPLLAMEWFKAKYPDRYKYLLFAQNQFRKWTIEELKQIQEAIKERNLKELIRFKDKYAT